MSETWSPREARKRLLGAPSGEGRLHLRPALNAQQVHASGNEVVARAPNFKFICAARARCNGQ